MAANNTSRNIVDSAKALLIAEGASAVTMRRVAADAGVTTMASYRHFPNREALLRTVVDEAFAELGEAWSKRAESTDFNARLFGLVDDFLDFVLSKPNLYAYLLTERRDNARRFPEGYRQDASPAFAPVVAAIEMGMRQGVLREDDPAEAALAVTSQTMGLVQMRLGGRIGLSEDDFRALCRRSTERTLNGLRT